MGRGGAVIPSVKVTTVLQLRGGAVIPLGVKVITALNLLRGGAVIPSVKVTTVLQPRGGAVIPPSVKVTTVLHLPRGSAVMPARILTMNSAVKMVFGSVWNKYVSCKK